MLNNKFKKTPIQRLVISTFQNLCVPLSRYFCGFMHWSRRSMAGGTGASASAWDKWWAWSCSDLSVACEPETVWNHQAELCLFPGWMSWHFPDLCLGVCVWMGGVDRGVDLASPAWIGLLRFLRCMAAWASAPSLCRIPDKSSKANWSSLCKSSNQIIITFRCMWKTWSHVSLETVGTQAISIKTLTPSQGATLCSGAGILPS